MRLVSHILAHNNIEAVVAALVEDRKVADIDNELEDNIAAAGNIEADIAVVVDREYDVAVDYYMEHVVVVEDMEAAVAENVDVAVVDAFCVT